MTIKNKWLKLRPDESEQITKIERYCNRGRIDKMDKNGFIHELYLVLNKDLNVDNIFFPKLEKLTLYGEDFRLQNADFLNLHKELKELKLSRCQLDYFPKLDNLQNLQILKVGGNNIFSLSGLKGLINLKEFSIALNNIQDLIEFKKISSSKKLHTLNLNHNNIISLEDIGSLLKLPNLRFINLAHNNITSLDGIEQLANHISLEELILKNNEIAELNITANIPNLKKINLNHNQISKITALRNLASLEQVDLSYNKIRRLENLDNLPNLKKITVTCNPLETLTELENLPSLELVENLRVTEWTQEKVDKLTHYLNNIGLYSYQLHLEDVFLDKDIYISDDESFLNIYRRECIAEFKINKYLSLKLMFDSHIGSETMIYVDDKPVNQCSFLLITIPVQDFVKTEAISSIDEVANSLNTIMEEDAYNLRNEIKPEEIFWGHCSNIQAWAEHDYDTRLLHSNLAFPVLKKLAEAGDPIARKVFKEEIAERYSSGVPSVTIFLREEGYLRYLSSEELASLNIFIEKDSNYFRNY